MRRADRDGELRAARRADPGERLHVGNAEAASSAGTPAPGRYTSWTPAPRRFCASWHSGTTANPGPGGSGCRVNARPRRLAGTGRRGVDDALEDLAEVVLFDGWPDDDFLDVEPYAPDDDDVDLVATRRRPGLIGAALTAAAVSALQARRVSMGLCRCGKPPAPERKSCHSGLERKRATAARGYAKRRRLHARKLDAAHPA